MTNDSKTTDECYELAGTLNDAVEVFYEPFDGHESTRIAAKILAAGYRKPRTITTAEELDGEMLLKSASYSDPYYLPSSGAPLKNVVTGVRFSLDELNDHGQFLPATVLYEPEAEATR
ncbi:hypothetical protein NNX28_16910 [Arthrobacter sp. zg-Y859]|uniref:Uncharacterized protein n=1 Tax=Arthrobacter jinronghuae TaxID=2964609 RepID=A0ABT1NVB6_9MICC|nr:hypothetical protein [Arthrobacter jinronghuae]MCQ1951600.1 hypothetical protein [Arthrobacter jinronghuae]UWX79685.1 hypothetical protein N2K98_05670 [Arthrobacter jinronghuae]